ncbi:MAG TPA: UDP-N-acetylmuramoyl-tripeptide--D-alanyl-D-alanine ligase [Steroidobacteraceae bacterium]|nr:UDP-N-acetylmuramoyl-tripeptide--D-alanyl-D-alanine ligase [Steroidobacteraceae bacterium]
MKRTLADFAKECSGTLRGADQSFSGVSSDTRTLKPGELFVALRGPRFDANQFVSAAHSAGAAGAVVDSPQESAISQIVVQDTQAALERLGHSWRNQFAIPVIGVAGSNGKTTTKEMTATILAQAGSCLATRGTLNNHIGVPLTLLRLQATDKFAVIEMGANHPGEVAALVRIARPTVGLITNAGAEHLEGFGSLEGVARAEGEMVEGLAGTATAVINADDEFASLWRQMTPARIVSFGVEKSADFAATDIRTSIGAEGFVTHFVLESPLGPGTPVELHMGGRHNVANALAAAAAASAAGATLHHVVAGLAAVRAVPGRLQFKRAAGGAWLIDDSYNANPSSVRAGIEVLASLEGHKWLVLGDMAELGEYAHSSHREIGELARKCGIERLYATGELAALAVESFGPGAQWFADATALAHALEAATADVRMLIKGSRVNRLERVVEALVGSTIKQGGV